LLYLDQLLKHPIIQKRIDYFKSYQDEAEDQALLQTIKIPKNLLFLSDKLPQPNYERYNNNKKPNNSFTKKGNNDLPDIRMGAIVNKIQSKIIKKDVDPVNPATLNIKDASVIDKKKDIINTDKIRLAHSEDNRRDQTASRSKETSHSKDRNTLDSRRIKNIPLIYDIPVIKPIKKKHE
jgi:hypothetical protein